MWFGVLAWLADDDAAALVLLLLRGVETPALRHARVVLRVVCGRHDHAPPHHSGARLIFFLACSIPTLTRSTPTPTQHHPHPTTDHHVSGRRHRVPLHLRVRQRRPPRYVASSQGGSKMCCQIPSFCAYLVGCGCRSSWLARRDRLLGLHASL